jgi:hypothetical protein
VAAGSVVVFGFVVVVLASGVAASPAGSAPIGLTPVDPGKEFVPV